MFAPPPQDPRWSVAIVRDDAAESTGAYNVGARLGDAIITDIEPAHVVLDVSGRREVLELLRRPAAASSHERRAPAAPTVEGVTRIGEHRYEVRRAVIDRFQSGGLMSSPRVIPEVRDGHPVGFRLFGIRPDSPYAAIGVVNGDLLLSVNGFPLATPDDALEAYSKLRVANHVSLVVERDGQRVPIDYDIR
jgi:general secretion pathway protein C